MPPREPHRINHHTLTSFAAIKALIAHGVADALAEYEAHRSSGNGDDSHESVSGRRIERAACERTYTNFLKCQPLNYKGTKGVDEVEKYVRGLLDMIQGSVMAFKPKTMQDAIEFATELMDKKIRSLADRQAENKRKLDELHVIQPEQQSLFNRH
ncbi:hypothetical protein Tco_0281133 [Tanacetum coccineum]